jgi:hypothetical protein
LADAKNINPVTMCLVDLSGRVLINKPFNPMLDVSFLKPGVYFLQILTEKQQRLTTRLMIAK